MNCPECEAPKTVTVDSRPESYGRRRRRDCLECGTRFTTYEVSSDRVLTTYQPAQGGTRDLVVVDRRELEGVSESASALELARRLVARLEAR